jgi:hypothetical protein
LSLLDLVIPNRRSSPVRNLLLAGKTQIPRVMKLRFEMTNFFNCTTTELKTALPFHNGNRAVADFR